MSLNMPVTVLGKEIGKCNGWDDAGECNVTEVYEFEPSIDLPPGDCVVIDYNKGEFQYIDAEGNISQIFNIVDIMARH